MNRTKSKTHGSQYSATSVDSVGSGGGLLSALGCDNKATFAAQTCLDAFRDKKPEIAQYVLENALKRGDHVDFSLQDCTGRSILHYLVCYAVNNQAIKQLLISCVSLPKCKKYINLQDDSKNTPAHYALYLGAEDIVRFLAENGANLKLKNDKGYSIELSNVPMKMMSAPASPAPFAPSAPSAPSPSSTPDIFLRRDNEGTNSEDQELNSFLKRIVGQFVHTSEAPSINFNRNSVGSSVSAGEFLNRKPMRELSISGLKDADDNIDDFVMEQFGGGSNKGLRRMIKYSEASGGDPMSSSSDVISSSDRLAREVTEASQAHERALEKIAALIGLARDALEVRAVKALLYEKIQDENAEFAKAGQPIRTNHERAIELEKRASDSDLVTKTFKNKAEMKRIIDIINKRAEERAANIETRKSQSQSSTKNDSQSEGSENTPKKKKGKGKDLARTSKVSDTSEMDDDEEYDYEEDEEDIEM